MSNTGPFQFRDQWYAWAPPWLRDDEAELYLYTLELCRDMLCEKMNEAMRIRIPGQGDQSQIPYLAYNTQLVQGVNETNANFILRITGANQAWGIVGSRLAVLEQLQAYFTGLQPGVAATNPQMAIVGGCYPEVTTWDVVDIDTPSLALSGGLPAKSTVLPANFNWDGASKPWRSWLVLYMAQVSTGLSGSAAATSNVDASACFKEPGQNVGGVWIPATSGTPVDAPWLHVTGLSGLTADNVQQYLNTSGSGNAGNNGTFQIVQIVSSTECIVANPNGVPADAGPITWSIGSYPYIGPGPVWGAPGYVFGAGMLTPAPLDTGSNVLGVWQASGVGSPATLSWGLSCSVLDIQGIRSLLKKWKSGPTYYDSIIVAFDGGDGTAGHAYSPLSSPGSGNPDGSFGGHGKNAGGVWVANRLISSTFDCYCDGTNVGYYVT